MNTQKTSEYIQKISNTLDKKFLSLSKKELNKLMDEIHQFAQDENQTHEDQITHEFLMLADLIVYAQVHKIYWLEEIKTHEKNIFKYILRRFIYVVIVSIALYYILMYYEIPENAKLKQILEQLKDLGVIVKQAHKGHGKNSYYYLDIVSTKDLLENNYFSARVLLEEAYQIHENIHGWIRWALIITGTCLFLTLHSLLKHIYNYFRQTFQKRYEKWNFIKKILWQRKEKIRKDMVKSSLLDDLDDVEYNYDNEYNNFKIDKNKKRG